MATRLSISSKSWEDRKAEILRLYVDESYPLKLVMKTLRTDDFNPTESQYRTKLKKWKRRKPRNTRLQRHHSLATTETSLSYPHGDGSTPSTNLAAPASAEDLRTTAYTVQNLTVSYPPEVDPQRPQPYRLDQVQADMAQPPPFQSSPGFDTLNTPENPWALIPVEGSPPADENSQDPQVLSAWRRAFQASPSQTRVLRQTRLREPSCRGEKQGYTTHIGGYSKISPNVTPPRDEPPLANPGYDPTTHTLDREHPLDNYPTSLLDGSIHQQRAEYQPIPGVHIQEHQPGNDLIAMSAFQSPQAAAYFDPGLYGAWPWGAMP
ncbi:MAG: hypothetical protein FRX48_00541 [Lasallia pustulata]|uniref:Clr5 domain-containing protein n=1 Tax=Lasallia pustulata TaxID=136370 RepID=A0A5M8Q3R1_9LECA|nr:MAG: hypothetical protein FRX48_00541 [Lasallia pustulata]